MRVTGLRFAIPLWPALMAAVCLVLGCPGRTVASEATTKSASTTASSSVRSDGDIARTMGPPYLTGRIVPRPKRVDYRDDTFVLLDGTARIEFFEPMFEYFGPERSLLLRLFEKRFEGYRRQFEGAWRTPDKSQRLALLFTLANDPSAKYLVDRYGVKEAIGSLEAQGYLLEVRSEGVLCVGKDGAGLVNGLASFLQLLNVRKGSLVVRGAGIVDAPTFATRYTAEYSLGSVEFFDWMVLYKLNGFASCYPAMNWTGLSDQHKTAMKVIREYTAQSPYMSYMVQFHVGGRGQTKRPVDCSDPKDVERLLETITETLSLSGARHIMLCYDDVLARLQPKEKGTFDRPAQAHGALVDRVWCHIQKINPAVILSFCTPYYQGLKHRRWQPDSPVRGEAIQYLQDTRAWNPNVRIVWTGPVTESREITNEDIDAYRALIGKDRLLFYWDNTWHYHQPLRDFHSKYPSGFAGQCADRTSYINVNGTSPIGKFFGASAADYYWNPDGFDPKGSRPEVVAQFMGPAAVPVADRFYQFRGDGYSYHFMRLADLSAFKAILDDLERVSYDPLILKACWGYYDSMAKAQGKPSGR